jgi:arabinose-5-phosphate isomerase
MLQEIFDRQQQYTQYFFDLLDLQAIEKLVDLLLSSKGIVFFTGVGKSGLIAKKIAFTMVSTGTQAIYISPTDAVHGDLGMISSQDTVILLSKSGESEELLELLPAIHNKGATLIAVVCNAKSRLAVNCHHTIILPFHKELCPFDMAPTMSTIYQNFFGDLLSIALMQQKKFTLSEYALNHPSGQIGKRITLQVKDLMLKGDRIPLCSPDQTITEILVELSNKRCGCILIVNAEKQLLGIFTDGDLRRQLQVKSQKILEISIKEVMSLKPRTIEATRLAWEALQLMEEDKNKRVTVLPVVDSNHIVHGIIHLHDILQLGL